jgi:predicted nuclease of restriction endonuclease-like (RecB) superfamily
MKLKFYTDTIKQLKIAILSSRYKAATLANRELLALYFNVGKLITEKTEQGKWGDKILEQLSVDLQHEIPGLKGFSATNIKRMKSFYSQWSSAFVIRPLPTDELQKKALKKHQKNTLSISPLPTDELKKKSRKTVISPSLTDKLHEAFFVVSFTHHCEILVHTKTLAERQFYIQKIATEFWSVATLKHHLKSKLVRVPFLLKSPLNRYYL